MNRAAVLFPGCPRPDIGRLFGGNMPPLKQRDEEPARSGEIRFPNPLHGPLSAGHCRV